MNKQDKKTTDQAIFSMPLKTFIPMMVGIILTTNTATGLLFNQKENTEQIEYNNKRSDRKLKAAIELSSLEHSLRDCEKELKECKLNK